jgi:hypothetical protein
MLIPALRGTILTASLAMQATPGSSGVPATPSETPTAQPRQDEIVIGQKAFDRLFVAVEAQSAQPSTPARQAPDQTSPDLPTTTIECGLVVIRPDPVVDSRMILRAPTEVDFKIRRIEPPVCKQ